MRALLLKGVRPAPWGSRPRANPVRGWGDGSGNRIRKSDVSPSYLSTCAAVAAIIERARARPLTLRRYS
jgi:hypothetical protein